MMPWYFHHMKTGTSFQSLRFSETTWYAWDSCSCWKMESHHTHHWEKTLIQLSSQNCTNVWKIAGHFAQWSIFFIICQISEEISQTNVWVTEKERQILVDQRVSQSFQSYQRPTNSTTVITHDKFRLKSDTKNQQPPMSMGLLWLSLKETTINSSKIIKLHNWNWQTKYVA